MYYGNKLTIVRNPKDELKTGTLHAMLTQLGLTLTDLSGLSEAMMHYFVYPATLTPDTQDGGFVVRFPDIPEAITQGDDVPEALQQAADCLEEAVVERIRRHEHIPTPSPVGSNQYVIPVPAQTAAKAALYLALRQDELTPFELALRLRCDEKEVQRRLDPRHASKLSRLEAALAALGRNWCLG